MIRPEGSIFDWAKPILQQGETVGSRYSIQKAEISDRHSDHRRF